MSFRFWLRLVAVGAGGLLLAGCRTASTGTVAKTSQEDARLAETAPDEDAGSGNLVEAHAHYAAGVVAEMDGDEAAALEEYHLAALNDPSNEAMVLEVSRDFLDARQPEKSLDILVRATAQPHASAALFARLGVTYFRLGKMGPAENASRTAIKKDPKTIDAYQILFLGFLQAHKGPEALAVLDGAAKVSNTGANFLIGLSELYLNYVVQFPQQKEAVSPRAITMLQRAIQSKPGDPQLSLRLANSLNAFGKDEAAAEIYRHLLSELPDVPFVRDPVRAKLADIYLRRQKFSEAGEQLKVIIQDNPTDAQSYYFLGSIEYETKHYPQAAEYFKKTLLLDPDYEQAYYDLAGAQMAGDDNSAAAGTLEAARKKFPQSFPLEYLSGIVSTRLKNYSESIKRFTAAEVVGQATDPQRLDNFFYFQFGAACERKGDYSQAEKYFEKCLQLAPNFADALNYLGYMWAEHGEKLDRARQLIEKAVKAEPKNGAYLDSMGWVLFKLKQPKEALGYVLKAIQAPDGEDAEVYSHLGDIYDALGETNKARDAWQKSLSLEPNDEARKKLGLPAPQ